MKDAVNKSVKDAASRYWRVAVTSKHARKQFKERLKANLGNLSLYCQPPKPCPRGTTDLHEAMKQWTWWPDTGLLERIEANVFYLALSQRKSPERRIWKAFELVNRREQKLHLLKQINDFVARAAERFRESGRSKLEDISWEQERDAKKAMRGYARASKPVRDRAEQEKLREQFSWLGGDFGAGDPSDELVRWLLKIGYPDMDELKAFNPRAVLESRLDELNKNDRERKAKSERFRQSTKVIKRTPEDAEDVRLMLLVINGDAKALAKLRERHRKQVSGIVREILENDSALDEIVDNVFYRLWKDAQRYVPASNAKFTTWLIQIAKRLALNEKKRASNREKRESGWAYLAGVKAVPMAEEDQEKDGEQLFEPSMEAAPMAGANLDYELMFEALSMLPKKHQHIVRSCLGCGCERKDHQELADELGITVSEVKELEKKALEQLRRHMIGGYSLGDS